MIFKTIEDEFGTRQTHESLHPPYICFLYFFKNLKPLQEI